MENNDCKLIKKILNIKKILDKNELYYIVDDTISRACPIAFGKDVNSNEYCFISFAYGKEASWEFKLEDYGKTWASTKGELGAYITVKQVNFINEICQTLDIEVPTNLTRKSASKFISEHIEEYKDAIENCDPWYINQ